MKDEFIDTYTKPRYRLILKNEPFLEQWPKSIGFFTKTHYGPRSNNCLDWGLTMQSKLKPRLLFHTLVSPIETHNCEVPFVI